jgi:hypothetical protein
MDRAGVGDETGHLPGAADLGHVLDVRAAVLGLEHPHLGGVVGVADVGLDEKSVQLGLWQRVGAVHLDRVLGSDDEEGPGHLVRVAVDRDLRLLHHLEQR